jgi:hypothetical protein
LRPAADDISIYNAFEKPDLIPSLVRMVDKTSESSRKEAIKKWVTEYGLLTASNQDSLPMFWKEAEVFAGLWRLYRQITSRELPELKNFITFEAIEEDDPFSFAPPSYHTMAFSSDEKGRDGVRKYTFGPLFLEKTIHEIEKAPLRYYQWAAFRYLTYSIEWKLQGLTVESNASKLITGEDEDLFRAIPHLKPQTLLQAMYLQFYALLNETDKICPVCNRQFKPSRKDQRYCSNTCKLTQRSRNFRARHRKNKSEDSQ